MAAVTLIIVSIRIRNILLKALLIFIELSAKILRILNLRIDKSRRILLILRFFDLDTNFADVSDTLTTACNIIC